VIHECQAARFISTWCFSTSISTENGRLIWTEQDDLAVQSKGVLVAFMGLGIVIGIGTAVYAALESLKTVDALYFTVVTATTVGFGDYYPQTMAGKIFTLFYVPFSVVTVAGAINHIAAVPLDNRRRKVENYVLSQFADALTDGDFEDIRRSAGVGHDKDIHANDFLVAMSMRLGFLNADDCLKINKLFANLDVDHSGSLTAEDITGLIAASRKQKAPVFTVGDNVRVAKEGSGSYGAMCEVTDTDWSGTGRIKVKMAGSGESKSYAPEHLKRLDAQARSRTRRHDEVEFGDFVNPVSEDAGDEEANEGLAQKESARGVAEDM
jgi:hypothetical protein